MKIAILGTGNVGSALGSRWAELGHEVIFGTRDPSSDKIAELLDGLGENAQAAETTASIAEAEVIVLTTPWGVAKDVVAALGDLGGKVLIDCTNPIAPGMKLAVGTTTSAAEEIAKVAHNARVVKAFNTTGAENMRDPIYDGEPTTMLICGDDDEAKASVAQLAEELGFSAVDAGKLEMARYLEPFAMVWIRLAIVEGLGRDIAFKLVRR